MKCLSYSAVLSAIAVLIVVLSGCNVDSPADLCSGKYDRIFAAAANDLRPWEGSRHLAGQSGDAAAHAAVAEARTELTGVTVPDADREHWEDWAHQNLVEIQHLLDDLDSLPARTTPEESLKFDALRTELSGAADELVQIHGLIHQGRVDRVGLALSRLQKRAERARGLACARD